MRIPQDSGPSLVPRACVQQSTKALPTYSCNNRSKSSSEEAEKMAMGFRGGCESVSVSIDSVSFEEMDRWAIWPPNPHETLHVDGVHYMGASWFGNFKPPLLKSKLDRSGSHWPAPKGGTTIRCMALRTFTTPAIPDADSKWLVLPLTAPTETSQEGLPNILAIWNPCHRQEKPSGCPSS